jgi:alcohol dehydrogenase
VVAIVPGDHVVLSSSRALHHHLGVSAFAEHVVVSARSGVVLDRTLPFDVAALFGWCGADGPVLHSARVGPGDSVAVFGLGGVGLAALLGARLAGAAAIVAVDVVPTRLELARELGATHAIMGGARAAAAVRDTTAGGARHVIETGGSAQVHADAYVATRRGGTTVSVGLPDPEQRLTLPAVSLVTEEKTLRGSYLGSSVPVREIPRFVALYQAGRLPVDRLLAHRLALPELNEGFDRLAWGEGVRHAVIF